ncbi:MAG TPA: OmpA family protein, partial [Steroidobacteraceae bacterium]|nr:OmpA family protein [Steroidobacteraceae bacterium]
MTPAGTPIENVATVEYVGPGGTPTTVTTNLVSAIVTQPPTTSALAILRAAGGSGAPSMAGPTQCSSSSGLVTLPAPLQADGTPLDPSQPISLASTTTLHGGEAAFVRVMDADQNRDSTVIDYLDVRLTTPGGDAETLRISETGANTGVFVGYIQTRAAAVTVGNCALEVERNAQINTVYVDAGDAADTSSASALVDPYGVVFDSRTGTPINGARVRLIDAATGLPAAVFGDDGVSSYPSEMLTGSPVTDAGGTVYTLPAGVFRFPLVAPGNYRVTIDPPAGYAFPSTLTITELEQTPGGPYRLSTGSFGAPFAADTPPAVAVDVPLDAAATQLFMQKSTTTTVAAVGDFVQYQLVVENTSTNAAVASVRVVDQLPLGARYNAGSTRIGADVTTDPETAADGRTLTFISGALGPGQRLEIRYVVEITAGARGKQLVNTARAIGPDGLASNSAQSTIQLREELFRNRAIVMGRVVEGDCASPTQQLKGVEGVRVYLEDGRYSVTDDEGKYHFEDVAPGSHVVQMDTVTIPDTHQLAGCIDHVRNAGRAYSQFVDVRGGALWRSDFVLARRLVPKGRVALALETSVAGPTQLLHTAKLNVTQLPISAARVMLMLPEGLEYQRGSAQVDGQATADPSISGNVLTFTLGNVSNDRETKLTLRTQSTAGASGAISVKALSMFDTQSAAAQRTAPVENVILRGEMLFESASYRFTPRFDVLDVTIQPADRAQLDKIANEWRGVSHLRLTAVGHSDQLLIAARNRAAFADNYALSRARAEVVANYLSERLSIDPARVKIEGRGSDEPLAAGHDRASLALNRRVDIAIEGLRVVAAGNLMVKVAAADAQVETVGTLGSTTAASATATPPPIRAAAKREVDVGQLQPGTAWITPIEDEIPSIPSLRIVIQHAPSETIELQNNGAVVSPLNFDGVETNEASTVSVSRWRGVDLRDGKNELIAIVRDAEGNELQRLTRTVHYSGGAVRAEIVREASTLIADGRTRPVIAIRMIDSASKPARPGTQGAFSVQAPYRSWWEVESQDDNKLVSVGTREPTFSVDADGLARLELEPTTQAGTAILRLRFSERRQQEIRVWLEPQARDWILVGLTENTAAYRTISDNMQSAADAGLEEGYSTDGRVAFFAKGAIKGEYLLTAAYDSARDHEVEKDRLLGTVEPDRFYTLYGDMTEQRFEAATSRKLFLKLERRQFAALFGDFETGLTLTELTPYSRTFTGLKSDYAGERFGYSAFAAESEQGYVKDELQGDGASGLYRLSRRPIILNSDKIRLEVRDRFRSEVVVESRPLSPFVDYSIDYLNGTLFFKQPVPSRDPDFNPVYIVAEYEVLNGGEAQMTAGGRASVKLANDSVEIGAS